MRTLVFSLLLVVASQSLARAQAQGDDVRILGRVNVNIATREELSRIPELSASVVATLLDERTKSPLTQATLAALTGEPERLHLKTSGSSDLRRIRQLPLERFDERVSSRR